MCTCSNMFCHQLTDQLTQTEHQIFNHDGFPSHSAEMCQSINVEAPHSHQQSMTAHIQRYEKMIESKP